MSAADRRRNLFVQLRPGLQVAFRRYRSPRYNGAFHLFDSAQGQTLCGMTGRWTTTASREERVTYLCKRCLATKVGAALPLRREPPPDPEEMRRWRARLSDAQTQGQAMVYQGG